MEFLISWLQAGLVFFHVYLNSWGGAIIALTLLLRLVLLPIQIFQFHQQRKMNRIQNDLSQLQKQWQKEPLRFYQESKALKEKEGVKTGLSLLAVLISLPLFISMYRSLSTLLALKGASFLWLANLATPDAWFLLPTLVALTAFLQQRKTSVPQAAALTKIMPVISFVFMVALPSGLVLYYAASGILQYLTDAALRKCA